MSQLVCSCCSNGFTGKQEPSHDQGFGTCNDCVDTVIAPQLEKYLQQGKNALESCSSVERWAEFCSWSKTKQDNFILMLIEKGVLKFSF